MPSGGDVTLLLMQWGGGDKAAFDDLAPKIYQELHRLAQSYLRRERIEHTLQATALVNEAYLKLVDQSKVEWRNRAHFFGIAAQSMRRILIDHARKVRRDKRGGGAAVLQLDEALDVMGSRGAELIALDDALDALAKLDEQQSRIVEMRYFAGLSIEEVAEVLGISRATVQREWATARAFLARELMRNGE
ncbi:MAG: sigma-70 family RNA polymerase sigma factor [Acidobacteria bacterium]|nr:sigma-70 family RNA polymerase sigma factor [Acidobacteriota bacterium]